MKPSPGKRRWSAPLADFVEKALNPVLAKQGFSGSEVVLHWEEIVGARLAAVSEPLRLSWPRHGSKRDPLEAIEPAALVLQVEGGFALEIQHLAPVILERVNAHLGWRCVGRLQLRQGPTRAKRASERRSVAVDSASLARARAASAGLAETGLQDAMTRLGAAILSKSKAREDAD